MWNYPYSQIFSLIQPIAEAKAYMQHFDNFMQQISGVRKKRAGVREKVDFSTVAPRTFWFFVLYSTLFADSKMLLAFGVFIHEVFLNIF